MIQQSHSWYISKRNENKVWKRWLHSHFIAALLTTAKMWKKPMSTNEWIKQMWNTHTHVEYYSAIKEKETLPWIPCRHICNRPGFQSSLPARLWQAPQSPPSMTESASLREERPVRACTPTHVYPADSQQDPWKTRTFSYPLTDWKKNQRMSFKEEVNLKFHFGILSEAM